MGLVSLLGIIAGIGVAVIAFTNVRSDIQITIGLVGAFSSGLFLALLLNSLSDWKNGSRLKSIQKTLDDLANAIAPGEPRKDAAKDFNDAVMLYQRHAGRKDAGDAIRDLAADALRSKGFLK
ncbi:hypothetical protein [Pelagibacterium halotolerans]|uniref:Uncharacterized protein n=1 Tax=Pelagibacterium halotolerans (strain DSM 22347 / JCM 15775 / CGMCC 1.7692 / B2) TaxID=1082931 RepID=G4RDZ8_PELHB|nr:hypothetical protein [Pelagibacterium halotolerans]AEQ50792.1 hypothetical protein KKY_753 [Pelagibacterium halotolerans B2]QJR19293.1 hypothetical protein HKM20_13100 [Pelagibacterium halotolerans]SDZ95976.1 hypothetical protein SAMN05428936_101678 [Pelagibacterium halotolerans]